MSRGGFRLPNTMVKFGSNAQSADRDAINRKGAALDPSNKGSTVSTGVGKGTRSYKDYFGMPGKVAEDNPYAQYPRDNKDLPEALNGRSYMMEEVLINFVKNVDQWIIRELFPWIQWEDGMRVEWHVTTFQDHMLDRVPSEASGRVLTSTEETKSATMRQFGRSMQLEYGFYLTPMGRQRYANQTLQIASATVETFSLGAVMAVLNIPPSWLQYQRTNRADMMDISEEDQVMNNTEWDRQMWGIMKKENNGAVRAVNRAMERLENRTQRKANYAVLPPGAREHKMDQLAAKIYRDPNSGSGDLDVELQKKGLTVRYSRDFRLGTAAGSVNPFVSERTIGDFFYMGDAHLEGMPQELRLPHHSDLYIHDGRPDRWVKIKYREAFENSGLFKLKAGKYEMGEMGTSIFGEDGDTTVGAVVRDFNRLESTIDAFMRLPESEFEKFISVFWGSKVLDTAYSDGVVERKTDQDNFRDSMLWVAANVPDVYGHGRVGATLGEADGYDTIPRIADVDDRLVLLQAFAYVISDQHGRTIVASDYNQAISNLLVSIRELSRGDDHKKNSRRNALRCRFTNEFAVEVARAKTARRAAPPMDNGSFGSRWLALRPSNERHTLENKQWWMGADRILFTTTDLATLAEARTETDAVSMVVVGAPVMTSSIEERKNWHVLSIPLRAEGATANECARAVGDALYVISIMGKTKDWAVLAGDSGETKEVQPVTFAQLWKTTSDNIATLKSYIHIIDSLTLHPFSYAWKPAMQQLVNLLRTQDANEIVASIESVATRRPLFLDPVPVYNNTILEQMQVFVYERDSSPNSKTGWETFRVQHSSVLTAQGLQTSQAERDLLSVAGQLVGESTFWEKARKLTLEADAKTSPTVLRQFYPVEMHKYTQRIIAATPELYAHMPTLMRNIYRKHVLHPLLVPPQTASARMGAMTEEEFVWITMLVEQAWKNGVDGATTSEERQQYNTGVALFMSEMYSPRFIDVPSTTRSKFAAYATTMPSTIGQIRLGLENQPGQVKSINDTMLHLVSLQKFIGERYIKGLVHGNEEFKKWYEEYKLRSGESRDEKFDDMSDVPSVLSRGWRATKRTEKTKRTNTKSTEEMIVHEARKISGGFKVADYLTRKDVEQLLDSIVITNGEFFRFALDHAFPIYFGLIGLRLAMQFTMVTMLVALGWGESGNTLAGHQMFMLGNNAHQQMIFGSYKIYGTTMIHKPENIEIARDVDCKGYTKGASSAMFNPNSSRDRENYWNHKLDKDIHVVAIPIKEKFQRVVMDATGKFNRDLAGAPGGTKSVDHYSTAEFYADFWRWSNGNNFMERPNYDRAPRPWMNTLAYQGHQIDFAYEGGISSGASASGAPTGAFGKWSRHTRNAGPWGPNTYEGCMADRVGGGTYTRNPDVTNVALL
jgi:hypothetical protein